jgi:hypothetical protein
MTEQQHNDTLANAINTGINSQGSASVSLAGEIGDNYFLADLRDDMDFYRFQGGSGDRIEWRVTANGLPWYLADLAFGSILYDANGNILRNSSQSGSGTYAFILPANGLYYLAAWGGQGRPFSGTFLDVDPNRFPRSIYDAARTGTYTLHLNLFDNTPNYPSPPPVNLAISATNANQTEGNSGSKDFTFTVTRASNTTGATAVNWAVTGSGTNPANVADFVGGVLPTGTVSFAAGETSKIITVNIQGDTTVEPNENFTVTLSSPTNGATITTATAIGTVQNDDISNIFTGTTGNDTLVGTTGADTLIGGSGNDTYIVDNVSDKVTETSTLATEIDTVQSSVTYTLGNNLERLTLTGTAVINGTGNTLNNTITGNSANNRLSGSNGNDILNGGVGTDTLTGGTGNDRFIFRFGQSSLTATDRITDFAIGTDKIDLLTQSGLATNAPSAFTRAVDSAAANLTTVVNNVFIDANGAIAGNQALAINSAALVKVTTTSIARTYLVINDSTAGFQSTNDLLVNITGFTGTIPALGSIAVNNFFV